MAERARARPPARLEDVLQGKALRSIRYGEAAPGRPHSPTNSPQKESLLERRSPAKPRKSPGRRDAKLRSTRAEEEVRDGAVGPTSSGDVVVVETKKYPMLRKSRAASTPSWLSSLSCGACTGELLNFGHMQDPDDEDAENYFYSDDSDDSEADAGGPPSISS